jgi:hypothetical protein
MYRGREELYAGFWWGDLREEVHLEDPRIDGWMDLQEVGCGAWTGSITSGQGLVAGTCECVNEPSGTIKVGNYVTS